MSVIIIDPARLRMMLDAIVAASTGGSLSGEQLETCQCMIDDVARDLKEILGSLDPPIVIEPGP